MSPLPIVSLVISLFVLCAGSLAALIVADHLAERAAAEPLRGLSVNLSLDSLILELNSKAA